jgi:hypothetical protein
MWVDLAHPAGAAEPNRLAAVNYRSPLPVIDKVENRQSKKPISLRRGTVMAGHPL